MGKTKIGLESSKLDAFKRWSKRLRRAAQAALDAETVSDGPLRPRDRADNVYRLMIYGYYRELKAVGLLDQLRQHVMERDEGQWKRHRESDELWVLRLATRGEQTDQMRKKRDRWAAELKLADVNDVQPELLLGFLHEAGPIDLIEQDAKREVRYPWAECYRQATRARRGGKDKAKREEFDRSKDHRSIAAQAHDEIYDGDSFNDDAQAHIDDFDHEEPRPDAAFTYGKTYGRP